jgi:hypothetical protein
MCFFVRFRFLSQENGINSCGDRTKNSFVFRCFTLGRKNQQRSCMCTFQKLSYQNIFYGNTSKINKRWTIFVQKLRKRYGKVLTAHIWLLLIGKLENYQQSTPIHTYVTLAAHFSKEFCITKIKKKQMSKLNHVKRSKTISPSPH